METSGTGSRRCKRRLTQVSHTSLVKKDLFPEAEAAAAVARAA